MTDEWNINGDLYGSTHSSVQTDDAARTTHSKKKVSYAFGNKASFAKKYQTLFGTISGGRSGRKRRRGGTHKPGM